ncbi:MAG: hypothetical protein JNM86_04425 [Phycisphaerae bacterium]|nr:hypothetical protein [Phycisphaerae bacterium]
MVKPGWRRALQILLSQILIGLLVNWMSSQLPPRQDKAVALQPIPVSIEMRPPDIQNQAAEAIDSMNLEPADLRKLRVVVRKHLQAFNSATSKSGEVGILDVGQIVAVVGRDTKWRLVVWRDPKSGEQKEGWVVAKRLRKID